MAWSKPVQNQRWARADSIGAGEGLQLESARKGEAEKQQVAEKLSSASLSGFDSMQVHWSTEMTQFNVGQLLQNLVENTH